MATPPQEPLVQASGLRKVYQPSGFTAVDGIDFELAAGEAFGFLGPNGAGKSSTMRMIGCVSPPTGGSLRILGLDAATEGPAIRENLLIYGRYFGLSRALIRERADRLLEFARLTTRPTSRSWPCPAT